MRFIWLFFMLFAGLLSACSNYKIVSFNNPEFENKDYQTFRLITSLPDSGAINQKQFINQVHEAILDEMKTLGYERVNSSSDLILRYKFFSNNRSESFNNNFRSRSIYDPSPWTLQTRNINESILLIDLHDRKKEKLVWQGSIDLSVSFNRRKKSSETIPLMVNEIFNTYQPKRAQ